MKQLNLDLLIRVSKRTKLVIRAAFSIEEILTIFCFVSTRMI